MHGREKCGPETHQAEEEPHNRSCTGGTRVSLESHVPRTLTYTVEQNLCNNTGSTYPVVWKKAQCSSLSALRLLQTFQITVRISSSKCIVSTVTEVYVVAIFLSSREANSENTHLIFKINRT